MKSKILDGLSKQLSKAVPSSVEILKNDLQKNSKSALAASLAHLNLVTREEFDIQRAVLLRSREKIEDLELKIAQLEQQITQVIKK